MSGESPDKPFEERDDRPAFNELPKTQHTEIDSMFEYAEFLVGAAMARARAESYDAALTHPGVERITRAFLLDDTGPDPHKYMHQRLTLVPVQRTQDIAPFHTGVLRFPWVITGIGEEGEPIINLDYTQVVVSLLMTDQTVRRMVITSSDARIIPDGVKIPEVAGEIALGLLDVNSLEAPSEEDFDNFRLLVSRGYEPTLQGLEPAVA